jgi:hypothetical protein
LYETEFDAIRRNHSNPAYEATLTGTDRAYLEKVRERPGATPDSLENAKFGSTAYQLFAIDDRKSLDSLLAKSDTTGISRRNVEQFLTGHVDAFWAGKQRAEGRIQADAFNEMLHWAKDEDPKTDIWRHEVYRRPEDSFKLWLFPRMALTGSILLVSGQIVSGLGVQLAEIAGRLKTSSIEGYVDFDLSEANIHDVGLFYNDFRGSHHGWYFGMGWNAGDENKKNVVFNLGLVPICWDLKSIPKFGTRLFHAQVLLRTGLRGEAHWDEKPWNIDPLQFQVGFQIGNPIIGPRHPLDY